MRQSEQSGNKEERKTMRNEEWGRNEEEMGECCFVGFPRLLHHQSTLQSFKEGQLRFVVSQLFIDTLKHLYTCAQIHTFSLTTTNIIHILPLVAICLSVCLRSPQELGRWCTCYSCHTWSQTECGSPSHSKVSHPCQGQTNKQEQDAGFVQPFHYYLSWETLF